MGSSNGFKPIKEEKMNLRRHWNEVKLFGDHFWQRWVKEFTPVLTRRTKWFERCPPISVGSVVIIVDENLPRNVWLKGGVTNTIPAKDEQVRRATIKAQHGVLGRPATKIAVLDVGLEDGNFLFSYVMYKHSIIHLSSFIFLRTIPRTGRSKRREKKTKFLSVLRNAKCNTH